MKTLLAGIAASVTLGVVSGAAMQPNLDFDPRPAGPQMFAGGEHVPGPFEDSPLGVSPVLAAAAANGKTPDYVLGSDWIRATEPPRYDVIPARPVFMTYNDPPEEPIEAAETAYEPGDAPPESFAPEPVAATAPADDAQSHATETADAEA
jgi:hypothetical protein